MDFSDTTIVVPAKDEEAVFDVVDGILKTLDNCRVMVLYNGYGGKPLKFKSNRVEAHPAPLGKGNAIIMMQKKRLVKTRIFGFIDGDATYEPKDFIKLVSMVRGGCDMSIGNRFHDLDRTAMPAFIEFGNKVITVVANILYGMSIHDSQTGIRVMHTSAFQSLELHEGRFAIEEEMNIKMRKMGYRIGEAPAKYYVRVGESKQMKLIDGLKLLATDFKFIFYRPRHRS